MIGALWPSSFNGGVTLLRPFGAAIASVGFATVRKPRYPCAGRRVTGRLGAAG